MFSLNIRLCIIHLFTTVGVTYDFHRNTLYWTTKSGLLIQLSLDDENPMPRNLHGLLDPTSVDVDYIYQRLYWIENANAV